MDVTKKGDFPTFDLIYLLKKEKLEWGILANGKTWRLYSILSAQPYENYLEIDFENVQEDDLRVFWQLFSLNLFIPDENQVTPLEKYIEESEKEAQVIEGHIRKSIDEILENICFGLLTYAGKDKQLLTEKEKQLYFDNAVYLLFRLLFMFYAESRELLPINNHEYRIKSLESLLEKARNWLHQGFPDANGTDLWVAFRDLCIDIGQGNSALKIPEYDGGLFDSYEHTFLSDPENQMANSYFATVLYKLGYLRKKNEETKIQYRDLSVRSLGSLYEGILEYKLFIANEEKVIRGKRIISAHKTGKIKKNDRVVPEGHVYFSQDANERHDTGSYYTPEDVVNYMVQNSIRLGLEERWIDFLPTIKQYEREIRIAVTDDIKKGLFKKLDKELLNFVEEQILTFKLVDPAMGSGHFLVNSLDVITHFIIEVLQTKVKITDEPIKHEKIPVGINWSLLRHHSEIIVDLDPVIWRRRVVEKCIFGIDINPLATELAKLSLWIASSSAGKPLTFLNHHLKCGDSIMGIRLQDLLTFPKENTEDRQINLWDSINKQKIDGIKAIFHHLLSRDSDQMQDILSKKDEYEKIEQNPVLSHLKDMATLWLMIGFDLKKKDLFEPDDISYPDEGTYLELLEKAQNVESEKEWENILGGDLHRAVRQYQKSNHVFHWELEFPEIIGDGFEAAVGNPPYVDVSAENYRGLLFLPLSSNNLYCYILAKSIMFKNSPFNLSFIIPMSIIASKRMSSLRKCLFNCDLVFRFINIDSTSNPGTIFKNVKTQLTIVIVCNNFEKRTRILSSNYIRFYSEERKQLFRKINLAQIRGSLTEDGIWPKIGTPLEESILRKMFSRKGNIFRYLSEEKNNNSVYYRDTGNPYYRLAFLETPFFEVNGVQQVSSTIKEICLRDDASKYVVTSLFPSSLFYWFWIVYSDCFHLTAKDIKRFPINLAEFGKCELKDLCLRIQDDLKGKGRVVTYDKARGITRYLELKPRYSKHLFDEVDKYFARYYGLTDEELEFIINYDIKYRTDN